MLRSGNILIKKTDNLFIFNRLRTRQREWGQCSIIQLIRQASYRKANCTSREAIVWKCSTNVYIGLEKISPMCYIYSTPYYHIDGVHPWMSLSHVHLRNLSIFIIKAYFRKIWFEVSLNTPKSKFSFYFILWQICN